MNCPVCASEHVHPVTNSRRIFFRCGFCGFSWSDSIPDEETSRARYGLHRNDERNEGYMSFLSRIIDRALAYTGMSCRGMPLRVIDWGSGPNPLGVKLLNQRGLESVPWDPFFASERTPPDAAFDLALCIEVAEHFMHPRHDFHDLARVLKPGAWALMHTHISPVEDEEFLRWWYIEDITHISFYSEKSLQILAAMASLSLINLEEGKIAMLRKPLPALIAGGINLDIEGQPQGNLIFNDSNPGKVRFSPGGCGRNMAENLSRLKFGTEFITVIGADAQGKQLSEASRMLGIGIAGMHSIQGASTSTYLSILDGRGNMAAAVSSMEIFEQFTPKIAAHVLEHAIDSAYTRSFGADPGSPFSVLLLDG
jgi:pseudouridine kinase